MKFAAWIAAFLLTPCAFAVASPAGFVAAAAVADVGSESCLPDNRAPEKIGKFACITGKVVEVHRVGSGATYLNFCRDYRDCNFAIMVRASDARRFGDLRGLQGREIRITGKVVRSGNRTKMIWQKPGQLQVAVDEKPKR